MKPIPTWLRVTAAALFACTALFSLPALLVDSAPVPLTYSTGYMDACAIQPDSSIRCIGKNDYGEATPLAGTFSQVSTGGVNTCAIRTDGTLACWGYAGYGIPTPPAGQFSQISTGYNYACAIRSSDRAVICWGANNYGESSAPAGAFQQVSADMQRTCGVRMDNTIACWGDNYTGLATAPAGTFTRVAVGDHHNCAIRTDNTLYCWGGINFVGQLNYPAGNYIDLGSGAFHSCAIRDDGAVVCWGDSQGSANPPAGQFVSLVSNEDHNCAARANGTLVCWGDNSYGEAPRLTLDTTLPSTIWTHTGISQALSAGNGTAPYRYAVSFGSLPPGFTLSQAGQLTGKPSALGFYTFTIQAMDAGVLPVAAETRYQMQVASNRPVTAGISLTSSEDTLRAFNAADFPYMDEDPLAGVQFDQLPLTGQLFVDNDTDGIIDPTEAVAQGGLVTAADLGKLRYAPPPNFNGTVTAAFRVSDGFLVSDPASTLTLAVEPVNDAPSASAASFSTLPRTPLQIHLDELAGDIETADGDLSYVIDTQPEHGSLEITGSLATYTPAPGLAETDSFRFHVVDRGDPDGCSAGGPPCSPALSSDPVWVDLHIDLYKIYLPFSLYSGINEAPQRTPGNY